MREIKFRGQRNNCGREWIYGNLVTSKNYNLILSKKEPLNYEILPLDYDYEIENDGEAYYVFKETIGEYTGLKDKNGKEIYEGDIVNMHYSYENYDSQTLGAYEDEKEVIGKIYIDWIGVNLITKDGDYHLASYLQEPEEELEVIGNVFDNPELLNRKEE